MIRVGVGVIVLGVLVRVVAGLAMTDTSDTVGANIGAGVLALLSIGVMIIGAVLAVTGIVRWLVLRHRSS